MEKRFLWLVLLAVVFCFGFVADGFSQSDEGWEQKFVNALQKGKEVPSEQGDSEGLGYTPSEEAVLEDAVAAALDENAPPCECMKIAVGMDYNPYNVLTTIYGAGKGVQLDEICMCATEEGIMKEVIAKAASDAVNPVGEKVFDRDEITQSQCLQVGLPYTAAAGDMPDSPEPPPIPPNSVATP
ncbi:MAG: hypothetical protein R6V41_02925 [Desulfobacteraceae bacterium]